MHRPTRPRLRTLTLSLALGALMALYRRRRRIRAESHRHGGTTTQPEPEVCADPPAAEVSSSLVTLDDGTTTRQDHLALFDVYWDYDDDADGSRFQNPDQQPLPAAGHP